MYSNPSPLTESSDEPSWHEYPTPALSIETKHLLMEDSTLVCIKQMERTFDIETTLPQSQQLSFNEIYASLIEGERVERRETPRVGKVERYTEQARFLSEEVTNEEDVINSVNGQSSAQVEICSHDQKRQNRPLLSFDEFHFDYQEHLEKLQIQFSPNGPSLSTRRDVVNKTIMRKMRKFYLS